MRIIHTLVSYYFLLFLKNDRYNRTIIVLGFADDPSPKAPHRFVKHCLLAKSCKKALRFAKSGGAVYNDHVRAQPMARLKRLEIGKRTLVQAPI